MSSWLSGLGGGGNVGSANAGDIAAGMAGGGGDIPDYGNLGSNIDTSGFNQYNTGGAGGGVSWADVQKAAKTLSDVGDASKQKDVANLPGAALPAMARPNTGVPAHAGALTALLQMLNQRRDSYLTAATNPRAGAVQQGPPAPGLLGV